LLRADNLIRIEQAIEFPLNSTKVSAPSGNPCFIRNYGKVSRGRMITAREGLCLQIAQGIGAPAGKLGFLVVNSPCERGNLRSTEL
jgi:hypothetical protein